MTETFIIEYPVLGLPIFVDIGYCKILVFFVLTDHFAYRTVQFLGESLVHTVFHDMIKVVQVAAVTRYGIIVIQSLDFRIVLRDYIQNGVISDSFTGFGLPNSLAFIPFKIEYIILSLLSKEITP